MGEKIPSEEERFYLNTERTVFVRRLEGKASFSLVKEFPERKIVGNTPPLSIEEIYNPLPPLPPQAILIHNKHVRADFSQCHRSVCYEPDWGEPGEGNLTFLHKPKILFPSLDRGKLFPLPFFVQHQDDKKPRAFQAQPLLYHEFDEDQALPPCPPLLAHLLTDEHRPHTHHPFAPVAEYGTYLLAIESRASKLLNRRLRIRDGEFPSWFSFVEAWCDCHVPDASLDISSFLSWCEDNKDLVELGELGELGESGGDGGGARGFVPEEDIVALSGKNPGTIRKALYRARKRDLYGRWYKEIDDRGPREARILYDLSSPEVRRILSSPENSGK